MSKKQVFITDKAPKPKGPYSQAVIYNDTLYVSGQIPVDPDSGTLIRSTIEEETEYVLKNIEIILKEAGAGMEDVIKATCYLADIEDFSRFNEVYDRYFNMNPPARTTFQAGKLPLDVQVEIDVIAALPGTSLT